LKKALSAALAAQEERGVDRILAAAFFRTRPLQHGTSPQVVDLAERRRMQLTAQHTR
jgi:hypothetical protein